jgi:hypothetical protein
LQPRIVAQPSISGVTIMRASMVFAALVLMIAPARAADPPKLAVFDFEMINTSLEGEVNGPRRISLN